MRKARRQFLAAKEARPFESVNFRDSLRIKGAFALPKKGFGEVFETVYFQLVAYFRRAAEGKQARGRCVICRTSARFLSERAGRTIIENGYREPLLGFDIAAGKGKYEWKNAKAAKETRHTRGRLLV
jgi:hypothetical protein